MKYLDQSGLQHLWSKLKALLAGKADSAHAHGSITSDGKIGTTADLPVFTGAGGAVGTKSKNDAAYSLGVESLIDGIAIPSGANLNDYITPGTHYIANASTAASLLNCPFSSAGGYLIVEYPYRNGTKSYIRQTARIGTDVGAYYYLVRERTSGTWGQWYTWVAQERIVAPTTTKLVTPRNIQTDLASTMAESFDGTTNITPGVTGILPIANGGTGNATGLAASATKLATARTVRTNLASTSTASFNGTANITPGVTGTLGLANGGTGATTATAARTNIGAASKTTYTATLTTTWAGTGPYTQTVAVSGILATDEPIADVALSSTAATARQQKAAWANVDDITAAANSITVTCLDEKPTTAIPIKIVCLR